MFYFGLAVAVIISFLTGWLLNKANKKIWKQVTIKWASYILPISVVIFLAAWISGTILDIWWIRLIGSGGSSFVFVLNMLLFITLPFSLGINGISNVFFKKYEKAGKEVDKSRRVFLKTVVSALPTVAVASAGTGFISSFSQTRFPQIDMNYPDLPSGLDGFKILQLSDLHLGYYFGLEHLENTLINAEKYKPDMVVVTGDIADDLKLMTDATKLIDQLKTPFPKYATLGNHEYFHGIKNSIREIEKGPIPLLINESAGFEAKGLKISVGGADDPVRLGGDKKAFFINALNDTFQDALQGDFRLLLSHRPNALDLAEKYNIDLTLSGHTHGGQIGLGGRSIWEIFGENGYLWGSYQEGTSKLYTTAGMGHWFPFRLNCPLEAPVITLKKLS